LLVFLFFFPLVFGRLALPRFLWLLTLALSWTLVRVT